MTWKCTVYANNMPTDQYDHYQVWFNLNSRVCHTVNESPSSPPKKSTHMSSTLVWYIKCKWAFIQFIVPYLRFNSIYSHFSLFLAKLFIHFSKTNFNVCIQFFDRFGKKRSKIRLQYGIDLYIIAGGVDKFYHFFGN